MAAASAAQLVIFDCDGVLVDSEPVSNRILAAAITEAGLTMTADEVREEFEAMRLADIQARVEERLGRPLDGAWLGEFEVRRETAFREGIEPIPGVEEVLRALSAEGRPICVASQARLEKTELTLGLTGLRRYSKTGRFSPRRWSRRASRLRTCSSMQRQRWGSSQRTVSSSRTRCRESAPRGPRACRPSVTRRTEPTVALPRRAPASSIRWTSYRAY